MNTFTDAQLIVSRDVVDLLDRLEDGDERATRRASARPLDAARRARLRRRRPRAASAPSCKTFFREVREGTDTLKVTVLTTLQCNFACDYCIQGDHGDYNKTAAKMSLEMAARVGDVDRARASTRSRRSGWCSRSSAASRC